MTSKTLNYSVKFTIHKQIEKKIVILHNCIMFNFFKASFYQNDVLYDLSIKIPGFKPIVMCRCIQGGM
jgi:hypothetical protein